MSMCFCPLSNFCNCYRAFGEALFEHHASGGHTALTLRNFVATK
jgi:hypothetical protein